MIDGSQCECVSEFEQQSESKVLFKYIRVERMARAGDGQCIGYMDFYGTDGTP